MSLRTSLPAAWPPVLTWAEPIAYDANGVIHEATREWLEARWGAPESSRLVDDLRAALAVVAAPPVPADSDADLDALLASIGGERVPDA